MIIGIDQSLTSTGVVAIDWRGELKDFMLICPEKELCPESTILHIWRNLSEFIDNYFSHQANICIAMEGLSFNSKSSTKDQLAGLLWFLRIMLKSTYTQTPVGVCPNQSWIAYVLSKDERKALTLSKIADKRKKAVVGKLPYEVKVKFETYIRERGLKKESLYDLADAWGVARYRLSLEP